MAERPPLIFPPFINKFYLMDLQPENSFVAYAVEQGSRCFLCRGAAPPRNRPNHLGGLPGDGSADGAARRAEITGVAKPNVLVFCIGGPMICSALALLRARGEIRWKARR